MINRTFDLFPQMNIQFLKLKEIQPKFIVAIKI